MTTEQRTTYELRASGDEGIIEGYVCIWDTVDAYTSMFKRGAFSKTLKERGKRVKVLWNHSDELVGKPLEMREDEKGLFARIQLVLGTQRGREIYELAKAGALDTFSFGFKTIKDKWIDGVRTISEVALFEISPVIFEANSAAVFTGVRKMDENGNEQRAQSYKETFGQYELGRRGGLILDALYRTLDDIWWSSTPQTAEEKTNLVDKALDAFAGMYRAYTADLLSKEARADVGALAAATRTLLTESSQTPEQLAASTSLTLAEVRSLLSDRVGVAREKVPAPLLEAFDAMRATRVLELCDELRAGLAQPERDRILGLVNPQTASTEEPEGGLFAVHTDAVDQAFRMLQEFRNSLSSTT